MVSPEVVHNQRQRQKQSAFYILTKKNHVMSQLFCRNTRKYYVHYYNYITHLHIYIHCADVWYISVLFAVQSDSVSSSTNKESMRGRFLESRLSQCSLTSNPAASQPASHGTCSLCWLLSSPQSGRLLTLIFSQLRSTTRSL